MEEIKPARCAKCQVNSAEKACMVKGGKGPADCPTTQQEKKSAEVLKSYHDPSIGEFARLASIQEAECYINRDSEPDILHPVKPRLQEIMEFAEKMGYKRLGLAFCGGLQAEAAALGKVLETRNFTVVSVVCKAGAVPKEEIGIIETEKVRIGRFETMCNPIFQAEILNEAKTDFNILMGLCVGHDSLFFKYAAAPTTVFAVKDRVLGHNPLAALYTLTTYYQRFIKRANDQ